MKKSKNIIIVALLIVIATMAVGYSALATQLKINGTAQIVGQWNVKIVGIATKNISEGCDPGDLRFTNTSATFNAKLRKPGDSITYVITIQNAGTIDAVLDGITITTDEENGSPAIKYTTTNPADSLKVGEQTTMTVTVTYDEETKEVPDVNTKTITGIIEYVQR